MESAETLNALGHAYFSRFEKYKNKNDLDTAETYYTKSLKVKPDYTIVLFNLGMLELERQNLKGAVEYF